MNTKARQLRIILGAGIALVVVVVLGATVYWNRKQQSFQDAPMIMSALQAFSRDRAAAGQRPPPEVSLQELIRGGYLTTNDVRAFEGMEVAFSTRIDDANPQMILAWAHTPDGQYISLLADGSVQGLSRQMFEQHRAAFGQGSATDGNPTLRAQSNSTSSVPGPPPTGAH